ncbi:MAG: 16S rRNA (uracil(1498)-N(3))-methyltransferase [Clostridia bacterium]|nr:16S rRNA (uracil(1498)-N(3))-methyltransferase [Clostridia bacterium]
MHRFFLDQNDVIHQDKIQMRNPDSIHHLVRVLRIQTKEQVELISNDFIFLTSVGSVSESEIVFDIIEKSNHVNESDISIDLFQCLPKGQKMEMILQKNVELGVRRFFLVESKRCIVEFKAKDIPKKIERYEKIIKEASKQSKRDLIPEIKGVLNMNSVSERIADYDLFIVLYENEDQLGIKSCLKNQKFKNIAVFVGPEGGFDDVEIGKMEDHGAKVVSLGRRILRTETAGFVATTCIQYESGGLE